MKLKMSNPSANFKRTGNSPQRITKRYMYSHFETFNPVEEVAFATDWAKAQAKKAVGLSDPSKPVESVRVTI